MVPFFAFLALISSSFAAISVIDISLLTPENNTVLDISDASFAFNATDDSLPTLSCSLYLNDSVIATNVSQDSGVITNYSVSGIHNGNYIWYVKCNDSLGTEITSGTMWLHVNVFSISTPEFPITIVTNYTYSKFSVAEMGGWDLTSFLDFILFLCGAILMFLYFMKWFNLYQKRRRTPGAAFGEKTLYILSLLIHNTVLLWIRGGEKKSLLLYRDTYTTYL